MGYRFDVLDNNVLSDDSLTRQVYPCLNKINKSIIFMPIFREQASISPYEHTKSISIRTCVCNVVQQLFIKYLIKKLSTLSVCKYAKTVNFCSSYALVDDSLEGRTPC